MSAGAGLAHIPALSQHFSQFIMFARVAFFLLCVAALTRAAAVPGDPQSVQAPCERYAVPLCTREYDPVCGSDGKSYPSVCMLCFDNMLNQLNTYIVRKGEC